MAIHYIRPDISSRLGDPFDCDEKVVTTLVTVGALVALTDGHIDKVERDQAVSYIDRRGLTPTISRQRIAGFFDARARQNRDFADLIADALRPVAALALTFDAVRIAELVVAADRHVDPNEEQMVRPDSDNRPDFTSPEASRRLLKTRGN
jgi:tellurite resistance protein